MLLFDAQGYLTPYDLIQTDWPAFADTFGWNEHRQTIINSLRSFVEHLTALSIKEFDMWINGSFVTQKDRPNDVDVVLFLPTPVHRTNEQALRTLRNKFDDLDVYFVRKIDEGERDHFLYLADRTE